MAYGTLKMWLSEYEGLSKGVLIRWSMNMGTVFKLVSGKGYMFLFFNGKGYFSRLGQ